MQDFEQQFIKEFIPSETRLKIYEQFCEWFKELTGILPPRSIWLDGSFLTKKMNPNDLDLVVFYRPEDISSRQQAEELQTWINVESEKYDCDAYFCLSLNHLSDKEKADFGELSIMETYWMGQFAFDRGKRPKGLVEITMDELEKIKGGVTNETTS